MSKITYTPCPKRDTDPLRQPLAVDGVVINVTTPEPEQDLTQDIIDETLRRFPLPVDEVHRGVDIGPDSGAKFHMLRVRSRDQWFVADGQFWPTTGRNGY